MPLREKVREQVKWDLSDEEKLDKGNQLATLEKELSALEEQKKLIPEQTKTVRARMTPIRQAILAGWEWRGVDCFQRLKGHEVEVVRCDTGEVVRTRPASQDDVQVTVDEQVARSSQPGTFDQLKVGTAWEHEEHGICKVVELTKIAVTVEQLEVEDETVFSKSEWNERPAFPREVPELAVGQRWSFDDDQLTITDLNGTEYVCVQWDNGREEIAFSTLNFCAPNAKLVPDEAETEAERVVAPKAEQCGHRHLCGPNYKDVAGVCRLKAGHTGSHWEPNKHGTSFSWEDDARGWPKNKRNGKGKSAGAQP